MADDVQPLSVPRQHPRPDLELFIRLDLPPEAAMRASQHHADRCADFSPQFAEPPAADPCHEMRACNVEVAEVGAIGFVDVPIALIQGGPGPDDERLEEGCGRGGRREGASSAVDLADEGVENANVPCAGEVLEVKKCVYKEEEFPCAWSVGKTEECTQSCQA